jgi:hypothetical protein
LEKVDKIKKSLEKAIKQNESEIGKCNCKEKQVSFEEEQETIKNSNKNSNPTALLSNWSSCRSAMMMAA